MIKPKSFDCVDFKNKLQEKLYKEIKPTSIDDYFEKIKQKVQKSKFLAELNKKSSKVLS